MYVFEQQLYAKHPNNHNIKAKIRQQLQLLRDMSYLKFISRGKYELEI
jgi:type II restriction enzyme